MKVLINWVSACTCLKSMYAIGRRVRMGHDAPLNNLRASSCFMVPISITFLCLYVSGVLELNGLASGKTKL
jgi:hypothetical protein